MLARRILGGSGRRVVAQWGARTAHRVAEHAVPARFASAAVGDPDELSFVPSSHVPKRCVVLGSGSFGTAMATVLARNSHHVTILSRSHETVRSIRVNHRNPNYLSDMPLPWNLTAAHQDEAERLLRDADYIIHCIPVQASPEYLKNIAHLVPPTTPIVSTSKGIHTESLQLMSEIIPEALGNPDQPRVYLSGPSFAKELMEGFPTGLIAASDSEEEAQKAAGLFASDAIMVWTSTDSIGTEIGGALKNPYAIASGMLEGLGLGYNTTALLVTRAIAEMNRLAAAMGSTEPTLVGMCGVGDLMLTSFGGLSRNRTVGVRLGRGESMEDIKASMTEVAEGVATTPAALRLAQRHNIQVPIIEGVNRVLQGESSPVEILLRFMRRSPGDIAAGENILPLSQRSRKK